jgi:hypothetical protein|tara:strand:- start:69 stop:233 length:165 start_codon:yes stop_codon:yes gene_type:complete
MGAFGEDKVLGVFETNDPYEFIRIFNDSATAEAMENGRITGGAELFLLDETFVP